ncbi:hypothetical protein BKA56DRAFT_52219 [Ilyonectria sp. MPI-CAGE-AT-0026]|nr:hypothetical protein BKA56DRAFT_52219 [Ilyonectria sp. MPI-CAGE-AT-0026]
MPRANGYCMSYRYPWLAVLPKFPKCHPRGGGCHFFPNLACLETTIMTRHCSASHNHDNRGNPTAKKGIATSATGFSRITALVPCSSSPTQSGTRVDSLPGHAVPRPRQRKPTTLPACKTRRGP